MGRPSGEHDLAQENKGQSGKQPAFERMFRDLNFSLGDIVNTGVQLKLLQRGELLALAVGKRFQIRFLGISLDIKFCGCGATGSFGA